MIETEIRSAELLPFPWFAKHKQESYLLAERLKSISSPYADRVEKCCDVVKVYTFPNGYRRLKSVIACRVMGCPICEQKRRGTSLAKLRHVLFRAKKEGMIAFVLSFSLPPHQISQTSSYMTLGLTAIKRISDMKIWRARGFLRFTEIGAIGDQILITYHLVVISGSGFLSGKYYVKLSEWQNLWEERIGEFCP